MTSEIDFSTATIKDITQAFFTNSCVLLRNFVASVKLAELQDAVDVVYRDIGALHIFPPDLTARGLPQFHEYLFQSKQYELLAAVFGDRGYSVSPITATRRLDSDNPHGQWTKPLAPHLDAFFHPFEFTVNFWVPLQSCGVDRPSLGVVCAPFHETIAFAGYDGGPAINGPNEEWNLSRFDARMRDLAYDRPAGLTYFRETFAYQLWTPSYELGDAMMLSNWTLHFSHATPGMIPRRSSVELRFSSDALLPDLVEA